MIAEFALVSILSFPAGRAHEFVKVLGPSLSKPSMVVFSVMPENYFKEFSADPADAGGFARIVKQATGLQQAPGLDFAFSDGLISRSLINVAPIFESGRNYASNHEERFTVSSGKVTVEDQASTFALYRLSEHRWKSEIAWHWMLDRYTMSISCKDVPEAEFLKLLAKSAGLRVEPTKTGFVFKINSSEFRRRANATFAKFATAEQISKMDLQEKWRLEMTQFALGIASDNHLQKAFDTQDGEAAILMEGQTKQNLGSKLLKMAQSASTLIRNGGDSHSLTTLKPVNENSVGALEFRGSPAAIAGFTEAVDWRRPVTLYLRSNFRVRIIGSSLPRDPNYSGPTAPVSVDF